MNCLPLTNRLAWWCIQQKAIGRYSRERVSPPFPTAGDIGGPTRPGIIHRLDRDTSGVILVAMTNRVHLKLSEQFETRRIQKEYFAVVVGKMELDRDFIRQPLAPTPTNAIKWLFGEGTLIAERPRRFTKSPNDSLDSVRSRYTQRLVERTKYAFTWTMSEHPFCVIDFMPGTRKSRWEKSAVG